MSDWRVEAQRKGGIVKTYSRRRVTGSTPDTDMSLGRPNQHFRPREGRGARMLELANQKNPARQSPRFDWQNFPAHCSGSSSHRSSVDVRTPVRSQQTSREAVSTGARPEAYKRRQPEANYGASDHPESYRRPTRDTFDYNSPPPSPHRPYTPKHPRSPAAKRFHPYNSPHRSPRNDQRRFGQSSPQRRSHTDGKYQKAPTDNRPRDTRYRGGENKENVGDRFRTNRRSANENDRDRSRRLDFNRRSSDESPKRWNLDLPSGLPNTQVQCYRNASLQALFGLEPFVQDLRLARKSADLFSNAKVDVDCASTSTASDKGDESASEGYEKVLVELVNVLMAREAKDRGKLECSLRRLNRSVARVSENLSHEFQVDRMNDANEYLGIILNALSEAAKKKEPLNGENAASPPPPPPNSPDPGSTDVPGLITNNFGFKTVNTLTCETCGKATVKEDTDVTTELHLAMPEDEEEGAYGRLKDYFGKYFAEETRERNCDDAECAGKVAKVRQRMSTLPRILLLNLKRYSYVHGRSHKNASNVVIPKYLSVSDVVCEAENLEPPAWERIPLSPIKKPSSWAQRSSRRSSSQERPGDCQRAMVESLREYEKSVAAAKERDVQEKAGEERQVATRPGSPMLVDGVGENEPEVMVEKAVDVASVEEGEISSEQPEEASKETEKENNSADEDEGVVVNELATRPPRGLRYRLTAIISHRGNEPNCGHYTADVYKVSEGSWYHFDDLAVSQRDELEILTGDNLTQGYIFFYMNENVLEKVGEGRALAGAMDLAEPLSP